MAPGNAKTSLQNLIAERAWFGLELGWLAAKRLKDNRLLVLVSKLGRWRLETRTPAAGWLLSVVFEDNRHQQLASRANGAWKRKNKQRQSLMHPTLKKRPKP
jgi:hypothetical protein